MNKGKRVKYPENWEYVRQIVIVEHYLNQCAFCGAKNKLLHHVFNYKVHLQVAHMDRNEAHNNLDNLKALCQSCHLDYDRLDNINRKRRRRRGGIKN